MRRSFLLGAVVALALVASSREARADGAVMVLGKLTPVEHDAIVDTVEATAKEMSWTFTAPKFSPEDEAAALNCLKKPTPWTCASQGIYGADRLVIVQVDSDRGGGAPIQIVTAHVLAAGLEAESFASRYCEMCNETALKQAVAELAKQLLRDNAERVGDTKLAIRSKPDKAWIVLDGKTVGATDIAKATYPGPHTIMLRHVGYKTEVRDVVAVQSKTIEVSLELAPDGTHVGPSPGADGPSRLVPGIVIGVGGAALVAGGLLIAVDDDVDSKGPQSRYYRDTATLGVATVITGAAVVGTGIYLWLRSSKTTTTATVAPLPGGGAVGIGGRF